MAVFKNGIFAYDSNGQIVNPTTNLNVTVPCGNFFAAVGTLNITQRNAIYQLVTDLKNYNIWDKMKAIYPMVGQTGVSSSFEVNLKDPSTFRGTFYGGWEFTNTGAKPNGSTGYMDTGLTSNVEFTSITGQHLCSYNTTPSTGMTMGGGSGATTNQSYMWKGNTHILLGVSTSTTINNNAGFALAVYEGGKSKTFNNNSKTSDSVKTFSGFGNTKIFISAYTSNGITPSLLDNAESRFASIGDGLTDTEAANFYTAVQRFQTTLGRQV